MSRQTQIIFAPYVGEFGWELMNWHGRVRFHIEKIIGTNSASSNITAALEFADEIPPVKQRWAPRRHRCVEATEAGKIIGDVEKVTIVAPPDRRVLYHDLIDGDRVQFCPIRPIQWPGAANEDHRIDDSGRPLDRESMLRELRKATLFACRHVGLDVRGAVVMPPPFDGRLWPTEPDYQSITSLRQDASVVNDIILVKRVRDAAAERNQTDEWWKGLATRLNNAGLSVAFLTPRLDVAVKQLSSARLAAGASTGGLHLASLCECPHYVWGPSDDERWTRLRMSNRQRYETIWNPLGTPCVYDATEWRPSIDDAYTGIIRALDKIGIQDHVGSKSIGNRIRWKVKRQLASVLVYSENRLRLPWRVREYARANFI